MRFHGGGVGHDVLSFGDSDNITPPSASFDKFDDHSPQPDALGVPFDLERALFDDEPGSDEEEGQEQETPLTDSDCDSSSESGESDSEDEDYLD